jgi:hypothetical protein
MKLTHLAALSAAVASVALAATGIAQGEVGIGDASPIYGVTLPDGYRKWQLIAPAQEAAPLNELRAVLGNDLAIKAYQDSTLPFPDGTVLVKLAWKHIQSPEFEPPFPVQPPPCRSWSRIRRGTRQPEAGVLAASSTVRRPMKRSTRPASPAIRRVCRTTILSLPDSLHNPFIKGDSK